MTDNNTNALDNNWHFALTGTQYGPVSFQDLRQRLAAGQVTMGDLVWHPSLPAWVSAGSLSYFGDIAAPLQYQNAYPAGFGVVYAGFWLRLAAYIIDYIVLYIPTLIVQLPLQFLLQSQVRNVAPGQMPSANVFGMLFASMSIGIILQWIYFAWMESSTKQATLGKMACGIKVTDMEGMRISFGHATGRYFGKLLSGLILCIGYMMAGWTEKKQALHDSLAKTLVVRK